MMIHLSDSAFLGYSTSVLICFYGACLFIYGLWVSRTQGWEVSGMYVYVLGLFLSLGYLMILAAIARYFTLTDPTASYKFRSSDFWAYRVWPLNIVIFSIVYDMTARAIKSKLTEPSCGVKE